VAALGMTDIDVAGYSFEVWVNAGIAAGCRRMVMVSPPVAFMDFGPPVAIERLSLIVAGGRHETALAAMIDRCRACWNPTAAFEVIPGADQFYTRLLKTLEDRIAENI
jgi:uncharacterized protein